MNMCEPIIEVASGELKMLSLIFECANFLCYHSPPNFQEKKSPKVQKVQNDERQVC